MKRIFVEFDTDLEVEEIHEYLEENLKAEELESVRWLPTSKMKAFIFDTVRPIPLIEDKLYNTFSGVEVSVMYDI